MLPGAAVRGFAIARYSVLSRVVLEFVLATFGAMHIQLARGMKEMRGGRRSARSNGLLGQLIGKPSDNRLVNFATLPWVAPSPSAFRSRALGEKRRLNLLGKRIRSNLQLAFWLR